MRRVTTVTQERRTHLQHIFCRCPMRVMTIGAVVINRFVAVHERTAFLRVAGIASLVNAIAFHQFRSDRTVRVMAVGTGHFAFWNRVMGRFVKERALLLVAVEADSGLSAFVANIVVPAIMDDMA